MSLISHIDGPNRDIYLSADTVGMSIHPVDLYKEVRTLRRNNEALRVFLPFLSARGNDSKGAGKFTERFVVCQSGTRIIPYNISHTLTVTGTIITDDGQEGIACFDRSPLSPTTRVDINYVPPQVEVITVSSGSGLDATQNAKLMSLPSTATNPAEIWQHNVEGAYSAEEILRLMAAALAGLVSGADGGTITFRDLNNSRNRIVATVDSNGNRAEIVLDVQ